MKNITKTSSVILLGAGRPYQGNIPSSLHQTPDSRLVLDWIIDAFSDLNPEWHFVGGFHLEEIAEKFPSLKYSINPAWQTTRTAESLFSAPIDAQLHHYVSYTDIAFSKDVVQKMEQAKGDIVVAVDSNWQGRYDGRTDTDIEIAEKLLISDGKAIALGSKVTKEEATAEFCGLAKITPAAAEKIIALRATSRSLFRQSGLLDLLAALKGEGLQINAVEIAGNWAELNATQDLARYVLGTKSETLERLRPIVKKSKIGDQVCFQVGDWESQLSDQIARIQTQFPGKLLAIRSSSFDEDGWSTANAGVFESVINVPANDDEELKKAIDQVITSYESSSLENQVLVQEMVDSPVLSGVAFTRTIRSGAPYYVINYDDKSGRTDTVTGGNGEDLKTFIAYRGYHKTASNIEAPLEDVLSAIGELEELVNYDLLDVEFAVTKDGCVHIFQIRPITVQHVSPQITDSQFDDLLEQAKAKFETNQSSPPNVVGDRNIFGIMPDWNPAEIVGTSPRKLALSLYCNLVTDNVWAIQREEFGYRNVRSNELLKVFLGHPYVDIRASFNSFIPADLNDELARKLVNYYIDRLIKNPHLHDKVEFDILFTSLTFCFEEDNDRLLEDNFSKEEINELKEQLIEITRKALNRYSSDLDNLEILEQRRGTVLDSDLSHLGKVIALLDDCKKWGTLPFAHLARQAFIAVSFLKSAVKANLISEQEHSDFMRSLKTVAERFTEDSALVVRGEMKLDKFLEQYGHLRPGSYEITSSSYAENSDQYLPNKDNDQLKSETTTTPFSWSKESVNRISNALEESRLNIEFEQFNAFLKGAIEGREYAKFVFSRNLSAALDCISEFGFEIGLDQEQLSHISIQDFITYQENGFSGNPKDWFNEKSKAGKEAHEIAQMVELPPLLISSSDIIKFHYPKNQPNFISLEKIEAPVKDLTENTLGPRALEGMIIFIPQADPGFDWLFGHSIAGLVTEYGGANSHMAIRAAEFGLPAVIGLGEVSYSRYRNAEIIELDCASRKIRIVR